MTLNLFDSCDHDFSHIISMCDPIIDALSFLSDYEKIPVINAIRSKIGAISPLRHHPVDNVMWVKNTEVRANDYNPNSVAPPEMELLRLSIASDGYTQPIVSWENDGKEVVDGFHRHRVGKECADITESCFGYLPIVVINSDREDRNDRMASTVRHNRARGEHKIDAMSDMVVELKRRFWSDYKIAKELGMSRDEVLRLQQISGIAEMFSDKQFSEAWEIDDDYSESDTIS